MKRIVCLSSLGLRSVIASLLSGYLALTCLSHKDDAFLFTVILSEVRSYDVQVCALSSSTIIATRFQQKQRKLRI